MLKKYILCFGRNGYVSDYSDGSISISDNIGNAQRFSEADIATPAFSKSTLRRYGMRLFSVSGKGKTEQTITIFSFQAKKAPKNVNVS